MPRGRPKTAVPATETELTEQQVHSVLDFAKSLSEGFMNGVYTPDLVNQKMKDINMNPVEGTTENIPNSLLKPKSNEQNLIGFSEYFDLTNMLYKRLLGYLGLMLSWDYTYTCVNAEPKDYKSKEYKADEKRLVEFIDKLDVRAEFKKAMKQMARQEVFYTAFRTDGDKYALQELPLSYCKLSGHSEYGYLFDFNMMYFMANPGVDINCYPEVFQEYYARLRDSGAYKNYIPSASIYNRSGDWSYWVQTSVDDNMWAFKFTPEIATQVPYLSPMFNDLVLAPTIRKLQTNKYIIDATKIIFGLIPLLKENKSGNIKDMMAISTDTAGKFLSLVRKGVDEAINVAMAPFDDIKALDFGTSGTNISEQFNKNLGASSGINSRLIYSTDKQNAVETNASIDVDEYLLTYLYSQFNAFMEFNINRLTTKYKFKWRFEGTEFYRNRETRLKKAIQLSEIGIVLPQKFASALGMDVPDLYRQMQQAKAMGFVDMLTPIMKSSQMSGKEGAGRPIAENPTDSALETQAAGSNIEKTEGS